MFGLQTRAPSSTSGPPAVREVRDAATTDGHGFRRAYADAAMQALRTGEALTFALLRIEHFPALVRSTGLEAAEHMMGRYARKLGVGFRADDVLARWSEDRFGILLPRTSVEGGVRALERALVILRSEPRPEAIAPGHPAGFTAAVLPVAMAAPYEDTVAAAESLLAGATGGEADRICWLAGELAPATRRILVAAADPEVTQAVDASLGSDPGAAIRQVEPAELATSVATTLANLVVLDLDRDPERALLALRRLRETSAGAGVAVIALSREHALLPRSFALGADDFVLKPVWPAELRSRVDRLFSRRVRLAAPGATSPIAHAS